MNPQPTFFINQFLTQCIMAIVSKECKPDNFESHSSLKLSFTNIWGLCSNFVECESFLESNSPDILALCETNLDDSIDFGNFSVRGYLPDFNLKGFYCSYAWSCCLCERRTSFCTDLISRKLCRFLLMFLTGFTSFSVLFLFLLWMTFFFMHGFWFWFYYSYAWSCCLRERRTSFCTDLISRKLCRFLLMFLTGFTSLSVLFFFLLWIAFFFMHSF